METDNRHCAFQVRSKFKSYYVVWKLEYFVTKNKYIIGFKSYYVVWKLFKDFIFLKIINKFKSYYVVWKLNVPIGHVISDNV